MASDICFCNARAPFQPPPSGGAAPAAAGAAEAARAPAPAERLEDVLGAEAAVAAMREAVVEPLAHARSYAELGVDGPRGVLVHGPPGCGKTFLGRSVAGSAAAEVPGLAYFEAVSYTHLTLPTILLV